MQTKDTFYLFIAETGGVYIWDSQEGALDYLGPSYLSAYSAIFLRFVLEYQSSVGRSLSVQIGVDYFQYFTDSQLMIKWLTPSNGAGTDPLTFGSNFGGGKVLLLGTLHAEPLS